MNTVTYSDDSVGSRIAIWLGLSALAVVSFYAALPLLFVIGLANGPVPDWVCLTYQALLGASGLLFLGSFLPLFWRAPLGAVRVGIGYLIVLGVIVVLRSIGS